MIEIKKKIIIIGCGWYGCHIANILKDYYDITMIDKKKDLFDNSSYYNQNRLHLGYHYFRNFNTRNLCQKKYDRFVKKYESLIDNIDNNYYVVSNESIVDFKTFNSIFNYENFKFELLENSIINNIDGKIIKVDENVINSDKALNYFKTQLATLNFIFNTNVINYNKKDNKICVQCDNNKLYECDILLDCTFNQLGLSKNIYKYELTISLLYEKQLKCEFDAITIMDGNFSSLYPRDISNNIYTLTDVEFTPVFTSYDFNDIINYTLTNEKINEIKNNMESKFIAYYSDFLNKFKYKGYFLSNKTKLLSKSDSRDINIEEIEKNVITVNCGKIYGIFEFEDYILKYLYNDIV
jgi:hypothetical protein